jgi:hypothetical protein
MSDAVSRRLRFAPPRAIEFGTLHQTLLISGVATILVIRTQLWLTNYPQLGGRGLHIAHLLWGGLFMLVAIGLMLTFLGRPVRRVAAVVGGIGFGFFIDELGKFVTEDNNYFYRPAAPVIYLIFVGLFLLTFALQRRLRVDPRDELANAVDLLGEAARGELDEQERGQALALLRRADPDDPLVAPLRAVFQELSARPVAAPGRTGRAVAAVRRQARRFAEWPGFPTFVSTLFAVWASLSVMSVFALVLPLSVDVGGAYRGYASDRIGDLQVANIASLASSLFSALLVARAILELHRGRRADAYRNFERALLVAIFITRVFSFFESQFGAVFGLAVDLLLLLALRSLQADLRRRGAPALDASLAPSRSGGAIRVGSRPGL